MSHRLFFVLIIVSAALVLRAESYVVYSVHGPVYECDRNNRIPILARATHLTDNSMISIGKGGSLTVYMNENRSLATVNEIGMQRLSTLLSRCKKTDGASSKWATALVRSLLKSDTPENTHRRILQSQGASHRGDDVDKVLANTVAAFLSGNLTDNWLPTVSVRFLSEDGSPIEGNVGLWQDEVIAEITNSGSEYIFVNLLAVVSGGERELIFPIDTDIDNNCCAHLIVQPHSTVVFTELPFFPSLFGDDLVIIPVASSEQINFTALCRKQPYDSKIPIGRIIFGKIEK